MFKVRLFYSSPQRGTIVQQVGQLGNCRIAGREVNEIEANISEIRFFLTQKWICE